MSIMKIKQFRLKRWMKICGGVVLALILFFLLLPVGAKYYLADWLEKNGADSATIAKLRFNPFAGRVTLGGLDVQLEGRSILNNASMVFDLGITSLFNRDIRVQKAEYHNLSIELEQYKDGSWRYGSYTLKGGEKETTLESGEDVASAWNILADQVTLVDCKVHLKTPELVMDLTIDKAELIRLSTREDHPAGSFTFDGQLNNSPIALQLDTVQLVPDLRIGGNISIAGFQLGDLSRSLSNVLPVFSGEAGLAGQLMFTNGAEKGIQVDYDGSIDLKDQDISNGDITTKAENVTWKGRINYAGPKESPVIIETDGRLAALSFDLQLPASELVVKESKIELTGKTKVTIAENILVENESMLLLEGTELVLLPFGIIEESLSWQGNIEFDSNYKQAGLFVRADGELGLGEFQVGGGEQSTTFATGGTMASWKGAVGFSQKNEGKESIIELNGTLLGGNLHTTLAEPQLRIGQGEVELKINTTLGLGENIDIGGVSSLVLDNFTLFEGPGDTPVVSFDRLAMIELAGRGGKTLAINDVTTTGVNLSLPGDLPLHIEIPEVRLSDLFTEDLVNFTVRELNLTNSLITAVMNNDELAGLDELTIRKISVNEDIQIAAEDIQLQDFFFLNTKDDAAEKPVMSLNEAILSETMWSKAGGLNIDTLHLNDLAAKIVRDKNGNINISERLAAMQQQSTGQKDEPIKNQPATSDGEESGNTLFALREVVLAGKSDIVFEDYTLAVPFVGNMSISQLEITGLDSSRPEQKTDFSLLGEFANRAPVEASGHVFPFKNKPAVDMQLELKNYPLSKLSSYTVQSVGTALASGQLQLKSSLVLADDKLDMDNAILLKKLETKTISPELAAELNNQLPISLDAALSLLRDNQGNIKLSVPLNGPVNELDVGISDVLITALSKAIVPAASGYLMYALGPYGALAYVGMKVGEQMLQVDLPPVVFVQQEVTLTDEHTKYLERIGKILQDRPETDIQICPRVASWEFLSEQEKNAIQGNNIAVDENNQDELLKLGQQRAEAVQSLLENDYDITRKRLLVCDTKIDTTRNAVPAVLLHL
ncbi:MAG: DUF748 domain-containing protein [Desulforhopalus sp.]